MDFVDRQLSPKYQVKSTVIETTVAPPKEVNHLLNGINKLGMQLKYAHNIGHDNL